jgi:hypothetical protein
MNHEPLLPDPKWERINNAPWTSKSGISDGTIYHPPQAYAKGFEEGAYALAEKLLTLFVSSSSKDAYAILLEYKNRSAHPARGWQHEKLRS